MIVQGPRRGRDLFLVKHGFDVPIYPITIRVCGPSRANSRSMADWVIETQPAVGEKSCRARCRNTALPRPAIRGAVL